MLCYQIIRAGTNLTVNGNFFEYSWILGRLAEQLHVEMKQLMSMYEITVLEDAIRQPNEEKFVKQDLHKGDIVKHWSGGF